MKILLKVFVVWKPEKLFICILVAGHGDDSILLFQNPPLGPLSRPQDLHVQKIIGTLWTNFASIGNPTVNGTLGFRWTPVTPNQPLRYLSLTTSPTMQPVDKLVLDFWKSLPVKLNKQLYPRRFRQDYGDATCYNP
ncbi:Venom carboxylesterase-6 [Chionoecetes opilio]|uniref:Venom carboxylesterase-6 n=1 Tax=Chionoecetes opilio TaxID=41210 RepID=A0A8J8WF48_CHIOP|nr:Venom carboxylesterase-6 [Chionoecetes opilio]